MAARAEADGEAAGTSDETSTSAATSEMSLEHRVELLEARLGALEKRQRTR